MKTLCKYHPSSPARWRCQACHTDLCNLCVKKEPAQNIAQCARCGAQLQQQAAGNFIKPFWQRIGKFFLYPAGTAPLILITLVSMVIAAVAFLNMFIVVTLLTCLAMVTHYANLVLETTATGSLRPPPLSFSALLSGWSITVKQFLVFLLMGLAIGVSHDKFGRSAGELLALFFMLGLPASIILLAINKSVLQAVNPLAIYRLMRGIGLPYLVLYAFLMLLYGSYVTLENIITASDNTILLPVQVFLSFYFMMIMYNMMGYVVLQYHDVLGLDVNISMDDEEHIGRNASRTVQAVDPRLMDVEMLLKEGKSDEALITLRKLAQADNAVEIHERFHKMLKLSGESVEMGAHARKYLPVLMSEGKVYKAAEMLKDCLQGGQSIQLDNPDFYWPLLDAMKTIRGFKEGVTLVANFHERFPQHKDIPRLYLQAARYLCEQLNEDEASMKLLNFLRDNFSQHSLSSEVEKYSNTVQALAKKP